MTVSNIASILVRARVVEMPCVCYYSQVDYPEGIPPNSGIIFWSATVPEGKKLVVKKCGVTGFGRNPESYEKVIILSGATRYEYDGVYNELELEFSSGTTIHFMIENQGTSNRKFGAWVMFDFVTE